MARKIWGEREEYRPYLEQAVELFPTLLGHVRRSRIFLAGFIARRSSFLAKIRSNKTPWSLLHPDYDYAIEFWDPTFEKSPEDVKVYVMVHELFHIPDGGFKKKGPEYRKLKKHDVEEFQTLVAVYGLNLEKVHRIMQGEKKFFDELEEKKHSKGYRKFPHIH
jgi:predicted metallopeptidase